MHLYVAIVYIVSETTWSLLYVLYLAHSWPNNIYGKVSLCFRLQNLTSLTEDEADLLLNLTTSETEESTKKHLPTGVPSLQVDSATCLMTQRDYITGYNYEVRMPVWAAYTLEKQVTV